MCVCSGSGGVTAARAGGACARRRRPMRAASPEPVAPGGRRRRPRRRRRRSGWVRLGAARRETLPPHAVAGGRSPAGIQLPLPCRHTGHVASTAMAPHTRHRLNPSHARVSSLAARRSLRAAAARRSVRLGNSTCGRAMSIAARASRVAARGRPSPPGLGSALHRTVRPARPPAAPSSRWSPRRPPRERRVLVRGGALRAVAAGVRWRSPSAAPGPTTQRRPSPPSRRAPGRRRRPSAGG